MMRMSGDVDDVRRLGPRHQVCWVLDEPACWRVPGVGPEGRR